MNHNPKNRVWEVAKRLFFIAGGICLILLIRQTGWKRLVAELTRIGWWFVPYMALHAADEALKTSAWKASFPGNRQFKWSRLYCISWIGSAVTQIYQAGELRND